MEIVLFKHFVPSFMISLSGHMVVRSHCDFWNGRHDGHGHQVLFSSFFRLSCLIRLSYLLLYVRIFPVSSFFDPVGSILVFQHSLFNPLPAVDGLSLAAARQPGKPGV